MNKFFEKLGLGTFVTGGVGLFLFLVPILRFVGGWIVGLILGWVFGAYVTDGLNLLLGTDRFVKGDLPMICATLAVVGGYFRSHQVNNNK